MTDEKQPKRIDLLGANLSNVRAARTIGRKDVRRGTYGGPAAGRLTDLSGKAIKGPNIEVLQHVETSGIRHVSTMVAYTRPSDGYPFMLEIDVFPKMRADIQVKKRAGGDSFSYIEYDRIHSLLCICPRCGPSAPKRGPRKAQGQILLYAEHVRPWFDDNGQLSIVEDIKCGWVCGWHVQIAEGRAYDRRGLRNLFSKVSWFH